MNNFFSTLFYIAVGMAGLLVACESEDLDWDRQKISFVRIEVDPDPIETKEEIILGATIFDIEDENLEPEPKPVTEYGHLYSIDRQALENLDIKKLDELQNYNDVYRASGRGFDPDNPNSPNEETYLTILNANFLNTNTDYFFMAYVVRPHDGEVQLSSIAPETFKVPILKVETVVPGDAEIEGEMKLRVRGVISEAKDVIIIEYGHRLLDEDCKEVIDSCARLSADDEPFTGELEFVSEFPFFDIKTTYCIQAYVKFQQAASQDTIVEYDNNLGADERFISTLEPGFWINTAKIRKKSVVSIAPPKLEGAVSFVLEKDGEEYIYVGLGRDESGNYNNKFWCFDPRFYTWEAVASTI